MMKKNFVFKDFFNNIKDTIKKTIKDSDKKIIHIIKNGFTFSSFICLLAIILLLVHNYFFISFDLIEAAMILFQTSLFFAMQFLLCGFAFDKILKMQPK